MSRPNIILTGFMGTGKSSTGKVLARKLDYEFVDTDTLIQSRQQRTIPEIFEMDGEAAFRQMEAKIAVELAEKEGLVIATGGRLMLDSSNVSALERSGKIFCLVADTEELIVRLSSKNARTRRPLLHNCDDFAEHIKTLLAERGPAYKRFEHIDTTGKKPFQVAAMLAKKSAAQNKGN